MRPADATGLVEEAVARRAKYGAFAYKAPVCSTPPKPRPPMEPTLQALAIFHEAAEIMVRRHPRLKEQPIGNDAKVLAVAAEVTGVSVLTLKAPRRPSSSTTHTWDIAHARFFACWLIRQAVPKIGLKAIGRLLGTELRPRDHTTCRRALMRFDELRDTPRFQEWINHPKTAALLKRTP